MYTSMYGAILYTRLGWAVTLLLSWASREVRFGRGKSGVCVFLNEKPVLIIFYSSRLAVRIVWMCVCRTRANVSLSRYYILHAVCDIDGGAAAARCVRSATPASSSSSSAATIDDGMIWWWWWWCAWCLRSVWFAVRYGWFLMGPLLWCLSIRRCVYANSYWYKTRDNTYGANLKRRQMHVFLLIQKCLNLF